MANGRPLDDPVVLEEVRQVLLAGSLANDAVLQEGPEGWRIEGDPTEAAFLVAEAKVEGLAEARRSRFVRIGEIPFTSERKLMTTLHTDAAREGRVSVATKGAPYVLRRDARASSSRVRYVP